MKRQFQHPESGSSTGRRYWRSLDELAATPGFQEQLAREFPEGASSMEGVNRRHFMKIMAASFALGGVGLAGCRRPEKYILPYGKSVEGVIPGVPRYFATAMPLRKSAIPLLAETQQGRPTKLEGNPTYTPHGTASSLLAQASVLDLYDPERATTHTRDGAAIDGAAVNALLDSIATDHAATGGAGLAFLAEESSSPTRARLVAALRQRFPQAVWAEYEPIADEPPRVLQSTLKPIYRFAAARRIVSLDADFLSAESGSLYFAREFAKGRRVASREDPMSRLYVAESALTLTGSMADHRLRLASSHQAAFAAALAARIAGTPAPAAAQALDLNQAWIDACAEDLIANRGAGLVVAGSHLPPEVHARVHGINVALGNVGSTIDYVTVPVSAAATIAQLATAIQGGSIRTLAILGGNPAYNAPADLDWPALQRSVAQVISLSGYVDETASLAGIQLAAAHYLESWGDARTADGTIVPIQPMIEPLFGGLTQIEVIARFAGIADTDPYALVRDTISGIAGGDADRVMRQFLHDGVLAGSAYPVATAPALTVAGGPAAPAAVSASSLEVRFMADHKVDDGRFANNGWLQECPDPITKISWDNAILVSPRLGRELGIEPGGSAIQVARKEEAEFHMGRENAPIGEVTLGGRTVRGPLHIQPGLSNYTIILPLGYGRTVTGSVGSGAGFSAYSLRTTGAMHVATGASIRLTGERQLLANTQEHWSMEGRDIIREANLQEVQEEGGAGLGFVDTFGMESHSPAVLGSEGERPEGETDEQYLARIHGGAALGRMPRGQSLYDTPALDGTHQWGMSIDLNTCMGCNACVVACQAENNIPIVGRDQVMRGREMHWIRLDRYYSTGTADAGAFGGEGNRELPEDPQVSLQPMTCQHCELAPCETVCPVNATVHDEEGLNTMAYNRCIGTRYCANNCPYKVRRFNFFDWNQRQLDSLYLGPVGPQGMPELVKMVKNPDVTVRMRGVMEKCTYCVQRIQTAKVQQKVRASQAGTPADVSVPDGTIKTACQEVCPVESIVFGNILDPESAVSQAKRREHDYAVLGYLNIRPRTTYLAKLRNPNPAMPDYAALPHSRTEYDAKNHPVHAIEGEAGAAGAAAGGEAHH
jgi:MoCo/4Fe-4S cofactor protein with predicted Tat translocation signal